MNLYSFNSNYYDRLDKVISKTLDVSRSYAQKLIKSKEVKVDDVLIDRSSSLIKVGQTISLKFCVPKSKEDVLIKTKADYTVLYEDKYLLIINKPVGLTTHIGAGNQSNTLVNALLYDNVHLSDIAGEDRLGIVHRLDKDTSGCLVIAKDNATHIKLKKMFKEKSIQRTYLALVEGTFKEHIGMWSTNIGRNPKNRQKMAVLPEGREAITKYKVIDEYHKRYSLVEFELITGRTHQIRVHCKYFNKPIVGDKKYGGSSIKLKAKHQLLHAKSLSFIHPLTGQKVYVEAPINEHFENVLNKLK